MSRKNKEKLRDRERRQEAEHRRSAIATPRRYDDGLLFPGVGVLRARVVLKPSGDPLTCWEVRETGSLIVHRSKGVPDLPDFVVGHESLAISHVDLKGLLAAFQNLLIPPMIESNHGAVLDGTRLVVRLEGGVECSSQFQWVQGYAPTAWLPLEVLTLSWISRLISAIPLSDAG